MKQCDKNHKCLTESLLRFEKFYKKNIVPYESLDYIYRNNEGYIVWRRGTGNNIELLHLKVFEKRKGYATKLIKDVMERLRSNPPYHSVFAFVILPNEPILSLYKKLGFNIIEIPAPYKTPAAFVWQEYTSLCKNLTVHE